MTRFPWYVVSKICFKDLFIRQDYRVNQHEPTNPSYGKWIGNPIALFYVQPSIFAPLVLANVNLTKINQMAWNHQLDSRYSGHLFFLLGKLFAVNISRVFFCDDPWPEDMTWAVKSWQFLVVCVILFGGFSYPLNQEIVWTTRKMLHSINWINLSWVLFWNGVGVFNLPPPQKNRGVDFSTIAHRIHGTGIFT